MQCGKDARAPRVGMFFVYSGDRSAETVHNVGMSGMIDKLNALARGEGTDYKNYKTSASKESVMRTLGQMKLSFMSDGMSEPEADRRVALMLDGYGIARADFDVFFAEKKGGL